MHTHSTASDGTLSPALLAKKAFEEGLSAVALSDHDTGDGLYEFVEAAESFNIKPIPAIEISTDYGCEVHILGYYVDYDSPRFKAITNALQEHRRERSVKMSLLLAQNGVHVSTAEAEGFATGNVCGRLHFAKAMLEKGYVKTIDEAFDKYLASGRCAYSAAHLYTPIEAVKVLRSIGSYPVLAHPKLMRLSKEDTVRVIKELKDAGLYGVECMHSTHDEAFESFISEVTKAHGLKITGGSDFHGENKPDVHIGKVYGGKPIPSALLTSFNEYLSTKN